MPYHARLYREAPGLGRRQKEQGESMGRYLYYSLFQEGKARQDKQV